jgi:hypothetical protein
MTLVGQVPGEGPQVLGGPSPRRNAIAPPVGWNSANSTLLLGPGRPRRRGDLRPTGPPETDRTQPAQPQRPPCRAAVAVRDAAPRHPGHAQLIQQAPAIPGKRYDKAAVTFPEPAEADALPAAQDLSQPRSSRCGLATSTSARRRVPARTHRPHATRSDVDQPDEIGRIVTTVLPDCPHVPDVLA